MFSPARLMTTSQRGSPDLLSSLHVIRPGPGCLETTLTSWPLAFSSWLRAVPMNPVPPPDGRAQTVYSSGRRQVSCGRPHWVRSHLTSGLSTPPPRCRGDTGHGVSDSALGAGKPRLGRLLRRLHPVACFLSSRLQPKPAATPSPLSPTSTRIATGGKRACARFKHRTRRRDSPHANSRARCAPPSPDPEELWSQRRAVHFAGKRGG